MTAYRCLSTPLRRTAFLALMACMALAAWSAIQPGLAPPAVVGGDKGLHLFVFCILTALARLASARSAAMKIWTVLLLAFGGGIELGQMLVPERDPSIADLVADLFGIAIGLLIGRWLVDFLRRLKPSAEH